MVLSPCYHVLFNVVSGFFIHYLIQKKNDLKTNCRATRQQDKGEEEFRWIHSHLETHLNIASYFYVDTFFTKLSVSFSFFHPLFFYLTHKNKLLILNPANV